jgi:RNA polymerase sigma-70 factor (ECF subfamily)
VTDPDEAALVAAVKRGEAAAYDVLVRLHLPRAYAVAQRVLRHREDAEDLVHDAFLRALDRIDQCEAGRPFGPWFFKLLMTQALNARRNRSRRQTDEMPDEVDGGRDGPDRLAEQSDTQARVADALQALPEKQRLVVTLTELEGFTSAEAAAMLEMPAGTVRWHLHQARQALRTALHMLDPSGDDPRRPDGDVQEDGTP